MDAFEELEVWKRSSRLCCEVYKALRESREWGLKDQLTRSALSVPSNIAEGYERNSRREFVRFLQIAKGSCGELPTQLYIAQDIGVLEAKRARRFIQESTELSRMLQTLIGRLEARDSG